MTFQITFPSILKRDYSFSHSVAPVWGERLLNVGADSVIFDWQPNRIWQQINGKMSRFPTPPEDVAI